MKSLTHKEGFLHRFVGFSRSYPEHIAIRDLDAEETVTYRDLRIRAEECNGFLHALNVSPGEKVALVLPNGVDFIAYYLAVIGHGAVPVILNYKLTAFELGNVLGISKPSLIVTTGTLFEQHQDIFQPTHALIVGNGDEPPENATVEATLSRQAQPLSLPDDNPIVSMQFTYRGIGKPLAVCHRYLDLTQSSDGLHEQFHPQGVGSVHLVTLLLGCAAVLQGYGLTESMPVIVQSSVGEVHRGAMGRPISGVELRVVDAQGQDVVAGRIGELLIRGSMVIPGYDAAPEINARFFRDGWLHTGDLVWRDEEGHVFFYCQRLRISKIKAQMVDLAEIESVALKHPDAVRARAYIVPDHKDVNVLHLSVEGDGELSQNSVTTLLSRYLSGFKLPKIIEIVPLKEALHAR
ncbi:class I adenylate-forming enzyme family protein [Pseudomonas alvandae]|uniref:class I adenylate-forming enzyme family protein n=1 Tax=Pseudomonas canavaninivorans TaxID=2842348 RepID=UPI002B1D66D3|nr:class I adenylate-forming enzyme family protein [Pseudomonas canavaninivorans]